MGNLIECLIEKIEKPVFIAKEDTVLYLNNSFKNTFKVELKELTEDGKLLDTLIEILSLSTKECKFEGIFYTKEIIEEQTKDETISICILSEKKNEQSAEKNSNIILQTIINNIPELVFYKDKDGFYRGGNNLCRKFYKERGIDDYLGKRDLDFPLDKDFLRTCLLHDKKVIEDKKQLIIEERIPNTDGSYGYVETIKTPVLNEDGEVWGIVGVVRDITNRRKYENELKRLSYTDPMTGLYNRAFFEKKIKEFYEKDMFPIGVIMGDVNGLKIVNDTLGHSKGDLLICEMAKMIKKVCKRGEFAFRWGGDEFVILIPNLKDNRKINIVDNITDKCKNEKNIEYSINISMGTSLIVSKDDKVDEKLKEAEDKLYRQKMLVGKSMRNSILTTLKESLNAKNVETNEHTERVLQYGVKIGKKLNLQPESIDEIILVAKLHDIGKVAIPDNILLKKGSLTEEEYEIMKTHTEKGYRLLMTLPELSHIARGVLTHHERWDGLGYPLGISGKEIPLISRIISVVDAFDAMISDRGYNKVKTKKEALEEIERCSGKHFDPSIVEVFSEIINKEFEKENNKTTT